METIGIIILGDRRGRAVGIGSCIQAGPGPAGVHLSAMGEVADVPHEKRAQVDPACRLAARARLAAKFATEEAKGHCRTVADADAVAALIDRFVADALIETAPGVFPASAAR